MDLLTSRGPLTRPSRTRPNREVGRAHNASYVRPLSPGVSVVLRTEGGPLQTRSIVVIRVRRVRCWAQPRRPERRCVTITTLLSRSAEVTLAHERDRGYGASVRVIWVASACSRTSWPESAAYS